MKRIFPLIVLLLSLLTAFSAGALTSNVSTVTDDEKISTVRVLGIMNGDENGNMNFDAPVTRAEFIKMVLSASSTKESERTSSVSLFPDVTSDHWACGYIAAAIRQNLVTGYLDGTFRPENSVRLEEGVIILLKALGYTTADFDGVYPDAQLAKYREIHLDTDISSVQGDVLSRYECMKLLYNLLCTKTKAGTVFCTGLGYPVNTNGDIDVLSLIESKMEGPYTYETLVQTPATSALLASGDLTVTLDGASASLASVRPYDVCYFNKNLRMIRVVTDKVFGRIDDILPDTGTPNTVKIGNTSLSLLPDAAKAVSSLGTFAKDDYVMVSLDKTGKAAFITAATPELYALYGDGDESYLDDVSRSLGDPIVVENPAALSSLVPFSLTDAAILHDNTPISASDIRKNDVLYVSELYHTVLVYRDTASGVLTSVLPSRESPSSVMLANKSYTLSTDKAKFKVSYLGTLPTESLVTLLLGKDGSAVDVLPADLSIIGSGEKQVAYADAVASTLKGPYLVDAYGSLAQDTALDLKNAVVYKNGKPSSLSAVKSYDVYYYSKLLDTLWLYDKTVTGKIDAIQPTAVSPSSVTVSGKNYSLETSDAQFALSSLGTYKVGDRVTLLLGKDGAVAGIVSADVEKASGGVCGFVVANGKGTYTDADGRSYTADTVSVCTVYGDTLTYEYPSSLSFGTPVRVTVTANGTTLSELPSPASSSSVEALNKALAGGRYADDAHIIEVQKAIGLYGTVEPSRLTGCTLSYRQVAYFELDDAGRIRTLLLNDVTGDLVDYGFITLAERTSSGAFKITYLTDGEKKSFSDAVNSFSVKYGPMSVAFSGPSVIHMKNLQTKIDVASFDRTSVYGENGTAYKLADIVRVYLSEKGSLRAVSLDDIIGGSYTVTAYADNPQASGGRVRVLVAS